MDKNIEWYFDLKFDNLKKTLESNRFECYWAKNKSNALEIAKSLIPKNIKCAFGGSMSVAEIGLKDYIIDNYKVYNQYDEKLTGEEKKEMRRMGLLSDWYITSCNALTESGELVYIDGVGNRAAAVTFGPNNVLLIVGKNKITKDIHTGLDRIRNFASPINVKRLNLDNPCIKTGKCVNCTSETRICNSLTVISKSSVKGRIKIILVNEDLGF